MYLKPPAFVAKTLSIFPLHSTPLSCLPMAEHPQVNGLLSYRRQAVLSPEGHASTISSTAHCLQLTAHCSPLGRLPCPSILSTKSYQQLLPAPPNTKAYLTFTLVTRQLRTLHSLLTLGSTSTVSLSNVSNVLLS